MKFTDETKTVIDMGDGKFVPVNKQNLDYVEIVLPAIKRGEAIEEPDPPRDRGVDPVDALKEVLVSKGLLTKEEAQTKDAFS